MEDENRASVSRSRLQRPGLQCEKVPRIDWEVKIAPRARPDL